MERRVKGICESIHSLTDENHAKCYNSSRITVTVTIILREQNDTYTTESPIDIEYTLYDIRELLGERVNPISYF